MKNLLKYTLVFVILLALSALNQEMVNKTCSYKPANNVKTTPNTINHSGKYPSACVGDTIYELPVEPEYYDEDYWEIEYFMGKYYLVPQHFTDHDWPDRTEREDEYEDVWGPEEEREILIGDYQDLQRFLKIHKNFRYN